MGFSEDLKIEIKKKSHYLCVVCNSFGPLHVHHITPSSEGGSDDFDNAVALCPSCHDIYQGNKEKRKWLREKRDYWYEYCEKNLDKEDLFKLGKAINVIEEANIGRDRIVQNLEEKIKILNDTVEQYSKIIKPLTLKFPYSNEIEKQNISTQIGIFSNIVAVSGVTMEHIIKESNFYEYETSGYNPHETTESGYYMNSNRKWVKKGEDSENE